MSKILFDKKRKKRIIHIAGHGKRQRLRKNTLFLKCLHLNCDSQLYILSHPSIHKNPLPGGFLCFLGVFLFVRDDRTAGSFPKQVSAGVMEWPATTAPAASGGNRKLLLGPRPARCECKCTKQMLGAATRIHLRGKASRRPPITAVRRSLLHPCP